VVVLVVVAAVVLRSPPAAPTSAPDSSSNPVATNVSTNVVAILPAGPERLVGNWLRPDGGYVLQIRSATADGKLDARYLNPNSINVARAEWRRKDAALQVFVELRDVNYPGSTYTLAFSAADDRLAGNYFQAAQQQNFDVEFVRQK